MGVFISDDELNTFNQNGISEAQVQDTVNQYRNESVSDDEIRSKIDAKLSSFGTPAAPASQPKKLEPVNMADTSTKQIENLPPLPDIQETDPPSDENTKVLTGGVEQKYTQNWDKDGKVYLTDEQGNRVNPSNGLNWFEKQGRKVKAWASNFGDYINATNGDIYNKKVGDVVSALSLFIPAFKAVPAINNPIAKGAANWAANGAVGGAVEGVAENLREAKSFYSPANIAKGAGIGTAFGGGLGAGAALVQGVKNSAKRKAMQKVGHKIEEILPENAINNQINIENLPIDEPVLVKSGVVKKGSEIPQEKITIGAEIPENLDVSKNNLPTKITKRKEIEKALGMLKKNWDQEPNFYSKEKENEAFDILSTATGKNIKWLKSQLKAASSGKGVEKRKEFIERILEHTDDKIDLNAHFGQYEHYNTNHLTYENSYGNENIGEGQKIAERAFDDVTNGNFDLDPRSDVEKVITSAEIEYKKIIKELMDSPQNDEAVYSVAMDKFNKISEKLPQEAQGDFFSKFYNEIDNVYNMKLSDKMRASGDLKQSKLPKTADLPSELRKGIDEMAPEYVVLHNKDLMAKSQQMVKQNSEALQSDLITRADKGDTNLEALDFENARQLVSKLYQEGKIDEALNLTDLISQKGSKAGQAVQSMSLWAKTTPEGAVRQAQRLIAQYNKSSKKQLPKLTAEQAQEVMDLAVNIHKQTDDRARNVATAQLLKYQSDLIPVNGWQKAKTLRNISLLLNPKTLARNIAGNGIFNSVDGLSKNIAAGIDGIVSKFTGKSTRAFTPIESTNAAISGAIKGAKEGFQDAKLGIDTRGGIGGRFDLPSQRSFKDPILGGLETALDVGLRVPDRAFYQGILEESVANQLKAQGLKEATPEIIEQANKEALEGVFQNDSAMSQAVLGARKSLNKVTNWISPNSKTFGLGDMVIPYAQTPANIVQQGINYSPAGFMKAVINGAKGDQRQATLDAARGIIGTGVMGAGYAGTKNGVFNGDYEDYNVRKNLETINNRPFQVNLPNGTGISYSQLQPVSIPLSAGTALAQDDKEKALQSAIGTITELPMLDSMGKLVRDSQNYGIGKGITNLMMNIPSQFIPTAVNQINAYVDPIQRETYDPNPVMRGLKQGLNKVPLASKALPKKYNVKGEEMPKYQSEGVNKALDVFINPVFVNKKKDDVVMQEVQALYDITGEKGSLLYVPERKIKIDGEQKELSGKEYSEYSKALGEETYSNYKQLMDTPRYQNADDKERLKLLGKVKENAKAIAQEQLFNKANKGNPKNAIQRKINNRINKGQNKIDRIMNKMDNQLIDNIMYEEE